MSTTPQALQPSPEIHLTTHKETERARGQDKVSRVQVVVVVFFVSAPVYVVMADSPNKVNFPRRVPNVLPFCESHRFKSTTSVS